MNNPPDVATVTDAVARPPADPAADELQQAARLPLLSLLALSTAVFITSLTETLPAGLLPQLSSGLHVSASTAGQTVTVYALGTAATAIPLTAATAGWRRKRLLWTAMAGFAVANTVTAVSSVYGLTMVARFVAGVAAGLAWALLAGYARRLAPEGLQGRAIAVAMAGIPVALALGVPAGTFIGTTFNWRLAFLAMSVLTLVLLAWISWAVPDFAGHKGDARPKVLPALRVAGVSPVLFVTLVFVLAHTILYAYVAAYLSHLGLGRHTDAVLLVFGVTSLLSIWIVGAHIHRRLRPLSIASAVLVEAAAVALAASQGSAPVVYLAAGLWGLGWGGVPTLLQTAAGEAGGEQADAAQAMLVTLWNVAMAAGGVVGGVLLARVGYTSLPWAVLLLLLPVLAVVLAARRHGFPARRAVG